MHTPQNEVLQKPKYKNWLHIICFAILSTLLMIDFASLHATQLRLFTRFIIEPILPIPTRVISTYLPSLLQNVDSEYVFLAIGMAYIWFLLLPLRWLKTVDDGGLHSSANRKPLLTLGALLLMHTVIAARFLLFMPHREV